MNSVFLLLPVCLPIAVGLGIFFLKRHSAGLISGLAMGATLAASVLTWLLIFLCRQESFVLLHLTDALSFCFRFDSLGRFYAGIVATLWPLTVLYAFSYMAHEGHKRVFYSFFTVAYGVTLGICTAGNLITLYCFYEMLTLSTVPLVMHNLTRQAVRAARTYLAFSLGGAAFAFASVIFLVTNGAVGEFSFGGLLAGHPYERSALTWVFFLLGFFGFGVKAAVFPLHIWLPKASVAPTPVTALLHAVAVVNSGIFAVMRLVWYCYGPTLLRGSWAQNIALGFAIITMVYGAVYAVKEGHWKRRLAYSTVSNLSYMLFGILLLTPQGLEGSLLHMAFHSCMKILAFFCAGAVFHQTGREYNASLGGLGRAMPVTFTCFTISAVALTGIPPFNGFVSKWYLLTAAAECGTPMAYAGAGALLLSALLTAVYMMPNAVSGWFGRAEPGSLDTIREADWRMGLPHVVLSLGTLITGLFAQPVVQAAAAIAAGG